MQLSSKWLRNYYSTVLHVSTTVDTDCEALKASQELSGNLAKS